MGEIALRPVTSEDRPRIVEISSQIRDGEAVARRQTRAGTRRDGDVSALACVRQSIDSTDAVTLNYAGGEPDDVRRPLSGIHHRDGGPTVETMVSKVGENEASLLPILREFVYESWDDCAAAVFVYELALR
jgi:hypothetical protein